MNKTKKSSLLEEALIDAKAVKAVAEENARQQILEHFSPKLESMLSKKIAEETGEDWAEDKETAGKEMDEELANPALLNADPSGYNAKDRVLYGGDKINEEGEEESVDGSEEVAPEVSDEEGSDVDVKINAPAGTKVDVVSTGEGEVTISPEATEGEPEEVDVDQSEVDGSEGEELELESIMKELADEADLDSEESEEAPETTEGEQEVTVDVVPVSGAVGVKVNDASEAPEGEESAEVAPVETEEDDEEINLSEILAEVELSSKIGIKPHTEDPQGKDNHESDYDRSTPEIKGEWGYKVKGKNQGDYAAPTSKLTAENATLKKDLDEALSTVKKLSKKLNEINLLNSKLLYVNKLFKGYGLTKEQKSKVVEQFDLARDTREVKLTYVNLAESLNFGATQKNVVKPTSIKSSIVEGLASKQIASTKPSPETLKKVEILEEGNDMAARLQKLAGIKTVKK